MQARGLWLINTLLDLTSATVDSVVGIEVDSPPETPPAAADGPSQHLSQAHRLSAAAEPAPSPPKRASALGAVRKTKVDGSRESQQQTSQQGSDVLSASGGVGSGELLAVEPRVDQAQQLLAPAAVAHSVVEGVFIENSADAHGASATLTSHESAAERCDEWSRAAAGAPADGDAEDAAAVDNASEVAAAADVNKGESQLEVRCCC